MPKKIAKTIPIFEAVEVIEDQNKTAIRRPVQARGVRKNAVNVVETGVDILKKNMENFIEGISEMLSAGAKAAGAFKMDTIEVECQVSGGGKVGFAGTGVNITGGSTLTITFRRKESD